MPQVGGFRCLELCLYGNIMMISNNETTMRLKTSDQESGEVFRITDLACFLSQYVGQAGVVVYSVGFIAAALSSMLTTPLGAALTADSVFSEVGTAHALAL